jgi:hypothetical protein
MHLNKASLKPGISEFHLYHETQILTNNVFFQFSWKKKIQNACKNHVFEEHVSLID